MISIGGRELTVTEIVIYFIVVALVIKVVWGAWDFIKDKLDSYHKKKIKEENIDAAVEDNAITIESINKSLSNIENQYQSINTLLEAHSSSINDLSKTVADICKKDEDIIGVQKIQLRHSIVRSCEEYLSRDNKEIESKELQSLEELNDVYHNVLHGNSYVHILMDSINKEMHVVTKYNDKQ